MAYQNLLERVRLARPLPYPGSVTPGVVPPAAAAPQAPPPPRQALPRPGSLGAPRVVTPKERLGGLNVPAQPPPQPGLAQRVLASKPGQLVAKGARVAGKVIAPLAAGGAVLQSADPSSTARYAQRFGVAEPTGDQSVADIAKFAALRAGGFMSDLGNSLTGGLAGQLYRDQPGQGAAPGVGLPALSAIPGAEARPTTAPLPTPTQAEIVAANNERGQIETQAELGQRTTTPGVADYLQGVTQGPPVAPQAQAPVPAVDNFSPYNRPAAPLATALSQRERDNPVRFQDAAGYQQVQERGAPLSVTGTGQGRVIGNVMGQEVRGPALGNQAASPYGELPAGDAVLRNEATGETRSYTREGLAQRAGRDVYTPAQAAAESQRRIASYEQQTAGLQEQRLAKEAGFEGDPKGFAEYQQNKALKAQAKALGVRGTPAAAGLARGAKGAKTGAAKPASLDQVKAARAGQLLGLGGQQPLGELDKALLGRGAERGSKLRTIDIPDGGVDAEGYPTLDGAGNPTTRPYFYDANAATPALSEPQIPGQGEQKAAPPSLAQFLAAARKDPRNSEVSDEDLTAYYRKNFRR